MKIAILGGSFDPPHLGHFSIALQVQEQLDMHEVWFMPAYHHPFQRNLSDAKIRLEMTKKLETNKLKVSDFEIQHNHQSFTIDTLNKLKQTYPEHTFYWITGSDQLEHFQKYKDWKDIITKHHLIIFPREWMLHHPEEIVKEKLDLDSIPENITIMQSHSLILSNISSTRLRERIQKGLPVKYFLPDGVAAIIEKNNLYV